MQKMTFEEGIERLTAINSALEKDEVALEDMMKLYKEGMELSKELSAMLDMTEKEIRTIAGGEDDA